MRLLLDTHLLIWAAGDEQRLSGKARELIENRANALWFSAASIWEIAIKFALEKPDFAIDPHRMRRGCLDNDMNELAVTGDHAILVASLPPLHRDPFDRLLVAQAQVEDLTLLTADATISKYPGAILKV